MPSTGEDKHEDVCWQTGPVPNCVDFELKVKGVPLIKKGWQMPNPKDLLTEMLPTLDNLRTKIDARIFEISMGVWDGSARDAVDIMAVPVFLLKQALQSMKEAKEIGEDIQEAERKNLILTILSAVLFFVPVVGQYGAMAAGMVATARAFAAIGAAGGTALGIVDIIDDPSSAPMVIADMLSPGRKPRGPKDYADAAKAKRAMSPDARSKTGKVYVELDDLLQRALRNACRKK